MYEQTHYNEVLQAVVDEFSLDVSKIPQVQWTAWRVAIKRLFDQNILISEIISAIPEAGKKMQWPQNVTFWKRIEDVVYLNRKHREKTVKVNTGMTGLSDLLK